MLKGPQKEMTVMARAFARAMGREFSEDRAVPVGAWYIERVHWFGIIVTLEAVTT